MAESRTGFMCRIAFDNELGETATKVYATSAALLRDHDCANGCGIVEVEVTLKRIVVEGQI